MEGTKRARSSWIGGVGAGNLTSTNAAGVPGKRTRVGELGLGLVLGLGRARERDGERPPYVDLTARARPSPGGVFEQATRGAPSALPHRAEMEAVFGEDFSAVQAFTGRGAEMAQLGAAGAAVGEAVVFGPSEPAPRLVAHELAHVVQDRRAGGVRGSGDRTSRPDDPAEREATEIAAEAERALAGEERGAPRLAQRIQQTTVAAGGGEGGTDEAADAAHADAAHADPAHADPAQAAPAQADAAHADAAHADAAHADAAPANGPQSAAPGGPQPAPGPQPATTAPEAAPHDAGRPHDPGGAAASAKHARTDAGAPAAAHGAATARPRMPGVEALGALSNLTPSNLAQAVREADRSLTLGAQAARAEIVAEAATAAARPPAASAAPPSATAPPAGPPASKAQPSEPSEPSPAAEAVADSAALASAPPPPAPRVLEAPAPPASTPDSGGVSAGPRPRVELTEEASPVQLELKRGASAETLGAEVLRAHEVAASAPAVERPLPPRAAPAPPPPIERPPIAVEEPRFLASVPPAQRPALEAAVAPVLQRRVADVGARVAEAQRRGDEQAAQIDARHQAAQAQRQAEAAGARVAAQAQVDQQRQAWQGENVRVQRDHQRRIDERQVRAQELVASRVETGEREVDASLTRAEAEASARLANAQGQAQAMIAAGRERAAAARASAAARAQQSGPIMRDATGAPSLDHGAANPEDGASGAEQQKAQELLDEVMKLNEAMLAAAQAQNAADVAAIRREIQELLDQNDTDMDQLIHDALTDLPVIARYYQVQIAETMALADLIVVELESGLSSYPVEDQLAELAGILEEQQGMLSDLTQLAQYNSVNDLAKDFGLDFTGNAWSSTNKQVAALGAVLTERALRDAAPAGRVDGLGFGELFRDVMGPIEMRNNGKDEGTGAETKNGGRLIEWSRPGLGLEPNDANIDIALGFGSAQTALGDSLLFNVIHELGHVFDNRARMHGRIDTHLAELSNEIPYNRMRSGLSYEQNHSNASEEEFADLFLNFVTDGFKSSKLEHWFEQQLYSESSPSPAQQDDWGWVDIARDRGVDSQWSPFGGSYYYDGNEGYGLDVAQYFGIPYEVLVEANRDKLAENGQFRPGVWLTIPDFDRNL